jgi:hypothetical protein
LSASTSRGDAARRSERTTKAWSPLVLRAPILLSSLACNRSSATTLADASSPELRDAFGQVSATMQARGALSVDQLVLLGDDAMIGECAIRVAGKRERGMPLSVAERDVGVLTSFEFGLGDDGALGWLENDGDLADLPGAFERIGCPSVANAGRRLLEILPLPLEKTVAKRRTQLDALSKSDQNEISVRAQALAREADARDSGAKLAAYIRTNRASFDLAPEPARHL